MVLLVVALLARSNSTTILSSESASGVYSGVMSDGSLYEFQVPPNWNGILMLYSHGYVVRGDLNPAVDAGDIYTGAWLLAHHYAVAGSSFSSAGWDVRQAEVDQKNLITQFSALVGRTPRKIIAWGHSLGGLITLELAQMYPGIISGAVSFCGVVTGGTPIWDMDLAAMAAFRALLGKASRLQLVDISDPTQNLALAEQLASSSQATPQGRARLALISALDSIPPWYDPSSPMPQNPPAQEEAQYEWLTVNDLPFFANYRAELESRAGGNFSSDQGFNYSKVLARSPWLSEVKSLYASAHLNLSSDLARLKALTPIETDPNALKYVNKYSSVTGDLRVPILTVHTTGDGLVPDSTESYFSSLVARSGDQDLLRQLFVGRAGHCTFSASETIVALKAEIHRVLYGNWPNLGARHLNHLAGSFQSQYNKFSTDTGIFFVRPNFVSIAPPKFPG